MPKQKPSSGKYLYAVVAGPEDRHYGGIGIGGDAVYTIANGPVSAVVSDFPNRKIRPERRNLAAHHSVLKRLMEEGTPLPMSFGVIADGARSVQKILSRNRNAFLEQLKRVTGKVEMGLRVSWDVPNIFDYFIGTHPELRGIRDRYFRSDRDPAQEEKIELGRMFDRILQEDREDYTDQVEEILSASCFEVKQNPCRTEQEVMNLGCLVGDRLQAEFEKAVFEAAGLFDNHFAFDYNGPWAPYNFVEINLEAM